MAHIVKRVARGTTSKVSSYVGPKGELIQDIDKNVLVMQTGVAGGQPLANGNADGMVTDVSLGTGITAVNTGQLGDAGNKSNVDANTLTTPGLYHCYGSNVGLALHYPISTPFYIKVLKTATQQIKQIAIAREVNNRIFERYSTDNGATWTGWNIVSFAQNNNMDIYISKDGSDTNTGLTSNGPVLTFNRAIEIAKGLSLHNGNIIFRVGAGDWGNVDLYQDCFSSRGITITNFAANADDTFPHFTNLSINGCDELNLGYIDADRIALRDTWVNSQLAGLKFGTFYANSSFVRFLHPMVVKYVEGNTDPIFSSANSAWRFFNDGSNNTEITLEGGLTNSTFLSTQLGSNDGFYFSGNIPINGTFSGRKYSFGGYTEIGTTLFSFPSAIPGTAGTGTYSVNGIPQQGVVLTSGDQEIGGNKTFTRDIHCNSASAKLFLKATNLNKSNTPSTSINGSAIVFLDSNDTTDDRIADLYQYVNASGDNNLLLRLFKWQPDWSQSTQEYLRISVPKNGDAFTGVSTLFKPLFDNSLSLGQAGSRWSQLYAGTATINTSDERVKSSISSLPDAVLDAWAEVNWQQFRFNDAVAEKGDNARLHTGLIAQRILEVFTAHGLDATRYGLLCHDSWEAEDWDETIVDKEAVIETVKVVDKEAVYATRTVEISPAYTDEEGVSHPAETYEEQYEVSPEVSHEEEHVIEPEVSHVEHHHRDAGDLYSLRYEEALCVEAAYQRRRADRMEARLAALEAKLA